MTKYNVKIPIYETIYIEIDTKIEKDAIKESGSIEKYAIEKAIEEQPKVYWMVDPDREIDILTIDED